MQLWTPEHARTLPPALIVMIALTMVLRHFLKDRNLKTRMIPFQIVTCLLLLLEVGKQSLSFARGYDLYHIPLHFCSLFLFVYPAASFYRGKHRQAVGTVTAGISAAVFLLMLIYPNLIYGPGNITNYFGDFFDFHTVTFHNLVMLGFLLIPALNLHAPGEKGETRHVLWFMTGFSCVAAVMAQVLKTNFANFYSCNIPVFEVLRTAVQPVIGYGFTQLIYVLCVAALQTAFTVGAYCLYRFLSRVAVGERRKAAS